MCINERTVVRNTRVPRAAPTARTQRAREKTSKRTSFTTHTHSNMTSLRIALLVAALALAHAAPAPAPAPAPSDDDTPEIIEIIAPAASAQETLDSLNLGEPGSELSERNKRTIGILRQLFPTLTQIVEQKIQNFTGALFRTFGPLFLGALGGSGGTGSSGSGTVTFDDDDDDSDVETIPVSSAPVSPNEPLRVSSESPDVILNDTENSPDKETKEDLSKEDNPSETPKENASSAVPKEKIESDSPKKDAASENFEIFSEVPKLNTSSESPKTDTSSETSEHLSSETFKPDDSSSEAHKEEADNDTEDAPKTISKRSLAQGSSADENQLLSGAESQQQEVRVQFAEGGKDLETAASEDQETAAQTNSQLDEISLEDTDQTEQDRNKRQGGFLNFNAGGSTGGSGGGSGNFLFDIIRLVAGSSATEPAEDGSDAVAADGTAAKGDNLTEGVPGPITRLFIIANRGIANLIQDLILRLAQTSERIVNFKARLITSII